MKALILAAGLGTRLRPLTEITPKPLLPIAGKPLLLYHLESLAKFGITDVLINTHYLHEQIEDFVSKNKIEGLHVTTVYEKELLGSAGTLKENKKFFDDEDSFLIVYGDNLTNIDYGKLIDEHKNKKSLVTIACYAEEHPETKGIINFNEEEKILSFIEKPKPEQITSKYANAGIYAVHKKIFPFLENLDKKPFDFGFELFPFLLEKKEEIYIYKMGEIVFDIGTIENYNKAQEIVLKF